MIDQILASSKLTKTPNINQPIPGINNKNKYKFDLSIICNNTITL